MIHFEDPEHDGITLCGLVCVETTDAVVASDDGEVEGVPFDPHSVEFIRQMYDGCDHCCDRALEMM